VRPGFLTPSAERTRFRVGFCSIGPLVHSALPRFLGRHCDDSALSDRRDEGSVVGDDLRNDPRKFPYG